MINPDIKRALAYLGEERAAGRWPTERWTNLVRACLRDAGLPEELLQEPDVRWLAGFVRLVVMPDRQIWAVPVLQIAISRAKHYEHKYDGDLVRSLMKDTAPLFRGSRYTIDEWARDEMNWDEVRAIRLMDATPPSGEEFQEAWVNGPGSTYDPGKAEMARRRAAEEPTGA